MEAKNGSDQQRGFDATAEEHAQGVILRISGELDANTAIAADDSLNHAMAKPVRFLLIDCRSLRYVSSAGLGVFLSAFYACQQKEINMVFFGLQPKIKNVFSILGLERIMHCVDTEKEALQSVHKTS
ncbi:STAS domain-containing protein [Pontibacter oryzae]|uniref:Anti-sigma factor antagonist n=1 Tax=Pontibacter oryzae TaxID=2304593 RepID=A0A399SJU4_9BACT|nr:STAS domain-containing protein [Pontibacter oryzae]RIJ42432.1 anti-sigma factor antagonist [Pontibacter oryzae]